MSLTLNLALCLVALFQTVIDHKDAKKETEVAHKRIKLIVCWAVFLMAVLSTFVTARESLAAEKQLAALKAKQEWRTISAEKSVTINETLKGVSRGKILLVGTFFETSGEAFTFLRKVEAQLMSAGFAIEGPDSNVNLPPVPGMAIFINANSNAPAYARPIYDAFSRIGLAPAWVETGKVEVGSMWVVIAPKPE